ncbi:hypothetical protein BVC80_1835g549 [Macleaya cordata]|uniref:Uncharacterized protein n=1 Tax=Macleaya cordata TaxID=56857 RepID=A0A200R618_MACCD|nr:hypothetical protein BVC80_1835g549 [Macleaya cordata]
MQPILNLHCSFGLPLCVSGITHRLAISYEIVDHELRRETMKKRQRSQRREILVADPDMNSHEIMMESLNWGKNGDLVGDLNDFSFNCIGYTAKAA